MTPADPRSDRNAWGRRIVERHRVARGRLRPRVPLVFVRRSDRQSSAPPRSSTPRQPAAPTLPWQIHVHLSWLLSSTGRSAFAPKEATTAAARPRNLTSALHSSSLWRSVLGRLERFSSAERLVTHVVAATQNPTRQWPAARTIGRVFRSGSVSTAPAPALQTPIADASRGQFETSRRVTRATPAVAEIVPRQLTMRAPAVTRVAPIVTAVQRFAARVQTRVQPTILGRRRDAALLPAARALTSATVEHTRTESRLAPAGFLPARTHVAPLRQATEAAPRALIAESDRRPLYSQPVPRSFAAHPQQAPVSPTVVTPPVMPPPPPAPPQIDVARLTEDVYHHLQRRVRIERERRGL